MFHTELSYLHWNQFCLEVENKVLAVWRLKDPGSVKTSYKFPFNVRIMTGERLESQCPSVSNCPFAPKLSLAERQRPTDFQGVVWVWQGVLSWAHLYLDLGP